MMAHYKPFHEPSREQLEEDPETTLRRLDTHDLKLLRDFWTKELYDPGLDNDIKLARSRVDRLNAEIERRQKERDIAATGGPLTLEDM